MSPYQPLFRNPHLATLAANFWPRNFDGSAYSWHRVEYETEPGIRILVEENRPRADSRGEVILQHGLEGSSRSGYLVSLAHALCLEGFTVHRVNLRGCGASEPLSASLYHSGLTHDLRFLLSHLREAGRGPRFLCGFSLGGNIALKLGGELGPLADGLLHGLAAVSTPIDLASCVRTLARPANWIYEQKFVRSLKARYRRRHAAFPHLFPLDGLDKVRTIYEFDDLITAPAFGFGSADNYYRTQSSLRFIGAIRTPTLLIQSLDDPLIPFPIYQSPEVTSNPHVELRAVPHGGHLGFLARSKRRFWLDVVLNEWISAPGRNKATFRPV